MWLPWNAFVTIWIEQMLCTLLILFLRLHGTPQLLDNKVDGPHLVTFLQFATLYYSDSQGRFLCASANMNDLELLWIIEFHWQWAISRPHRSSTLRIMLTIKARVVNKFWACSPIIFKTLFFLVSVLESVPNHPPLKCRRLIKISY
jgi:hypothetical protein